MSEDRAARAERHLGVLRSLVAELETEPSPASARFGELYFVVVAPDPDEGVLWGVASALTDVEVEVGYPAVLRAQLRDRRYAAQLKFGRDTTLATFFGDSLAKLPGLLDRPDVPELAVADPWATSTFFDALLPLLRSSPPARAVTLLAPSADAGRLVDLARYLPELSTRCRWLFPTELTGFPGYLIYAADALTLPLERPRPVLAAVPSGEKGVRYDLTYYGRLGALRVAEPTRVRRVVAAARTRVRRVVAAARTR